MTDRTAEIRLINPLRLKDTSKQTPNIIHHAYQIQITISKLVPSKHTCQLMSYFVYYTIREDRDSQSSYFP